jgi:NAD+ kinase
MLASRPAVLPGQSEVRMEVHSKHGTAQITADGQERIVIASGDTLVVHRGEHVNNLVRTGLGLPFYEVLRTKLKWGFREPSERS